ncbi:MAG: hypothetical protein EBT64_01970, partial [Gammaproteobacteria bacterium]|nr:hypothetical protein [Gammaproteobacteria bacterium]
PGVFGRLGEEMDHLAAHGINFEVVPGVTAATAAGADARVAQRRWPALRLCRLHASGWPAHRGRGRGARRLRC